MLAGGTYEESREQIRKRGMILPVADQTAKKARTPQKSAIRRSDAAYDDMISATGANVAAVEKEFFRAEARTAGEIVKVGGIFHQFPPGLSGVNIHLNHTRVGGYFDNRYTRVEGRSVALNRDRDSQMSSGILYGGNQVEIVPEVFDRR